MFIQKTHTQLSFCKGNSGDPIFNETFGAESIYGSLPSGSNSGYQYIYGEPNNGFYTIASSSFGWFDWFNIGDHTENDTNGRMLIVNAASRPGEFFEIAVSGLCENTSYEFSSWLINLLPSSFSCPRKVPINVKFEIWDSTDAIMLKSGDTGNIYSSAKPNWQQYGLVFQTKPGQTSVILKMRNNGVGGCGNDLAIDDIMFRTCGDSVIIKDSVNNINALVYKNELPYSATLTANPDFSVFSSHFYQWQESTDGVNWINIAGENNNSFLATGVNSTAYYRVLVAEDAINLLNSSCNSTSEVFKVNITSLENPNKPQKKVAKPRDKLNMVSLEKLTMPIKAINIKGLEKLTMPLKIVRSEKLTKTQKKVIIVRDGFKIIYDEVWIDGAKGKFVQTGEEIITKGDINGGVIIEETIYYKAKYGYNSIKRMYSIQETDSFILR